MVRRKAETFEPVTMDRIRDHGCRDLLVYCNSGRCHHSATMNGDHLADDAVIRALGPKMVCTHCGHIGADVRPDWRPKRHVGKYQRGDDPATILSNSAISAAICSTC